MIEGRCDCGEVRYRMHSAPIVVHCCHCRECQRQTGSAFVLNAIIETDRFEHTGNVTEVTVPSGSGMGQVITSCAKCGVAVFSSYKIREDKVRNVRVGTLEDPDLCPPDVHIFTKHKQAWLQLGRSAPVFEEFYDFKEVWPADAQARWGVLFDG